MSIYVEILIHAKMDDLWNYTQTPDVHERWDLRFSSIEYLPRPNNSLPQQFLYSTRIGFGLTITGKGESVGSREDSTGSRTSVLKFWSDDPRSLIREGSGYWKYVPTPEGIRFLTQYNYKTRFGLPGRIVGRIVFKPMLGWATAWSFDRLRLWLEKGIEPDVSLERSVLNCLSRITLAAIWVYQGLIPKLLFRDSGEVTILQRVPVFHGVESNILCVIGVVEILFGTVLLLRWSSRRLLFLNILLMVVLGVGALICQPAIFAAPFNPFTLNLAMITLSIVGLVCAHDLPSAKSCCRVPSENPQ